MVAVCSLILLTLLLLLVAFSPPSLLPPCVQNLARSFAKKCPGGIPIWAKESYAVLAMGLLGKIGQLRTHKLFKGPG